MLGLFCSSVLLKEHDDIPLDEAIFYVFAAVGLLLDPWALSSPLTAPFPVLKRGRPNIPPSMVRRGGLTIITWARSLMRS